MKAVLLQPPFFRAVGSHNDRAPLELAYASAYLKGAGIDHVLLNADYTGAATYIPWRQLFEQFDYFKDAVDGRSALYSETLERVLQYDPEVVVISAGDGLVPVLDCGSPWIGARLSEMLRARGVKTVGVGPFFGTAPQVFGGKFDALVRGMLNGVIVEAVDDCERRAIATVYDGGAPVDVIPHFGRMDPEWQWTDTLLTAFGCPWACDYCYAPKMLRGAKFVAPEMLEHDLRQRWKLLGNGELPSRELYVRDMVFPLQVRRLQQIAPIMNRDGWTYVVEARADNLKPELLEAMRECGVVKLKMGIEVMDDGALQRMNKGEGTAEMDRGIRMAKEAGFRLTLYVLLGGLYADRAAYERTIDYVEEIAPESVVVNVASYQTFDAHYRYDAHFSPFAAMQWRVDYDVLQRFLELQDRLANRSIRVLQAV